MSSIVLLRATLPSWATLRPGSPLRVAAEVEEPDGTPVVFELRMEERGPNVLVWEDGSAHLPKRCPARHFYADGSFCMGFGADGAPPVVDEASARRWWAVLHGYLGLQQIAAATGEWPARHARPHGPAAIVEAVVELAESILAPPFAAAIRDGRVRRGEHPGRVRGRRQLCPCGSRRQIRHCHEAVFAEVLEARRVTGELEKAAWDAEVGPCCGTMRVCPLRDREASNAAA